MAKEHRGRETERQTADAASFTAFRWSRGNGGGQQPAGLNKGT